MRRLAQTFERARYIECGVYCLQFSCFGEAVELSSCGVSLGTLPVVRRRGPSLAWVPRGCLDAPLRLLSRHR